MCYSYAFEIVSICSVYNIFQSIVYIDNFIVQTERLFAELKILLCLTKSYTFLQRLDKNNIFVFIYFY